MERRPNAFYNSSFPGNIEAFPEYGEGPEGDVAFTTRTRFARNLKGFPFPYRATREHRRKILEEVEEIFQNTPEGRNYFFIRLEQIPPQKRQTLVEAHLISPTLAKEPLGRAVAYSLDPRVSVMVNEEDHLRVQSLYPGFQPEESFQTATQLEEWLGRYIPYAFRSDFGFLTTHLANIGTGLRFSVMLHLPALSLAGEIKELIDAATRVDVAVRGLYGEGSDALGDLYQVSNRYAIGLSEDEIVGQVRAVVRRFIERERSAREWLSHQKRSMVADTAWRAYGILRYARRISSQEALNLLSSLHLGNLLGLIHSPPAKVIRRLMAMVQPAFLQNFVGTIYTEEERDRRRADLLRYYLEQGKQE